MKLFDIFKRNYKQEPKSVANMIKEKQETITKEEPVQESIIGFEKAYDFLDSNYKFPVKLDGIEYGSPSTALEASKMIEMCRRVDKDEKERKELPPIEEFVDRNLKEMTRTKFFTNQRLGERLMGTGSRYLNDTTVDNKLGRILMGIRDELIMKRGFD